MLPPCLLICFVFCMDLKMFIGLFNTIFVEKSGNCNQLKCISTGYVLKVLTVPVQCTQLYVWTILGFGHI